MAEVQIDDGLAVEVAEEGSGRTVVLVHGSASDSRTWQSVTGPLAERFRVLVYSRRYHWPNPPATGDAGYSMAQHVEDLAQLLAQVEEGPVDVVGHSYGGFVGLLTAHRHPELVRQLVLIEPPVVPLFLSDPPRPAELLRVLVSRPRLGLALLRFGATGLVPATKAAEKNDMDRAVRSFGRAVLGKVAFERLSPERWEQIEANNIRAEYLSESFDPLDAEIVRSIRVPTLLLSGADSPAIWSMLADHLHELLPNSRRVEIPDASHIVQEDNAAATVAAIRDFLPDRDDRS